MTYINLDHVRKHYVQHEYHFDVNPNDFILITGQNGTGKTTLLQLLMGYIRPDKGIIEKKNIRISFVSDEQKIPNFMIVRDYLTELKRIKKSDIDFMLCVQFELPLDMRICELSKGNRQKLILVSSFIGNPEVLIYDEPLTSLDQKMTDVFIQRLKQVNPQQAVIVVSHQREIFYHLANKEIKL